MQDSVLSATATFGTLVATQPQPDYIVSVILAIVSGILAPLVKEYIVEKRNERRLKNKKEKEHEHKDI